MSDKPMTEYIEYKYPNDVSDVAAKMSDVNDIIERVVTVVDPRGGDKQFARDS